MFYIYLYIYIERERERQKEVDTHMKGTTGRGKEIDGK
jgi:hypothetical protein